MDALQKRTESFWTLTWLSHGCRTDSFWTLTWLPHVCFAKTDGAFLHVNTVATWMLGKNGRSLSGRYHGCHMDALQKRTECFWTLTWLPHGCSAKTDGVFLDVNMVVTWMLCKNGRSFSGCYHGCHMDALQKRTESFWTLTGLPHGCFAKTDGLFLDVKLLHGCSAKTDGVFLDVIMVATWMICKNRRTRCGR